MKVDGGPEMIKFDYLDLVASDTMTLKIIYLHTIYCKQTTIEPKSFDIILQKFKVHYVEKIVR